MVCPGLGSFSGHGTVSAKTRTALGKLGCVGHPRAESCENVGGGQGEDPMFLVYILETALLTH